MPVSPIRPGAGANRAGLLPRWNGTPVSCFLGLVSSSLHLRFQMNGFMSSTISAARPNNTSRKANMRSNGHGYPARALRLSESGLWRISVQLKIDSRPRLVFFEYTTVSRPNQTIGSLWVSPSAFRQHQVRRATGQAIPYAARAEYEVPSL